jgi:GTP-binding protein
VDGQLYIAAKGGAGGKGNAWFATWTNQAPRYAQEGIKGEERWVILELKLFADVGIIGLPNVGKSTFISKVSAARPKIADYPFTTLVPHLGVVKYGNMETFVIADIPGLIKGAHEGMGMGTRFLRHIERTSVLLHVIDISQESYGDAWQNFETVNGELFLFNPSLMEKPQVVTINKIDLPDTRERIKKEIDIFDKKGIKVSAFSAVTGEGVTEVIHEITKKLHSKKAV